MKNTTKRALLIFLLLAALCFTLLACSDDEGGKDADVSKPNENTEAACKHTDTTVKNKLAASCGAEGYSGDTVCTACGKILKKGASIAKTEHTFDDGQITKDPTCATTGVKTFTCTGCLITKTETVPTVDCQNEFHYESNEIHKIVCGICYTSENGSHTKGDLVTSADATCTEGAYAIYNCKDCKNDYKVYDTSKPALDHDWDENNPADVAATCQEDGRRYFICKREGCTAVTQPLTLPKTPNLHHFTVEVSHADASCTEAGSTVYRCEHCEKTETKTLPKQAHTYGSTVTSGAWSYQTCTGCGHEISSYNAKETTSANITTNKIEENKALKVDLKDATIEFPSSVVDQIKENKDVKINAGIIDSTTKNSLLSKPGLSEEDKAILSEESANIYDFGVTSGSQSLHEFSSSVTVTLPYSLNDNEDPEGIVIWYVAEDGTITAIENVSFTDEDGDRNGTVTFEVEHFSYYAIAYKETPEMRCRRGNHDLSNEKLFTVIAPTCTSYGYTQKICAVCGDTTLDNYVIPTTHDFGSKQQPDITCTTGGYVYDQCKHCSTTRLYEYVPASGHTVNGVATCTKGLSCTVCKETIVAALGHSYTEWEVIVKPALNKEGLKRRHCPRCGHIEEAKIVANNNVEPLSFDSYEELIEICLKDIFNFGNGTFGYSYEYNDRVVDIDVKVMEDSNGYTAEIAVEHSYYDDYDEETYTEKGVIYYRNGALLSAVETEDSVFISELESIFRMSLKTFMEEFESMFDEYSAERDNAILTLSESLHSKLDKNEKQINELLSSMGCTLTAKELVDAFDALHTVYAYTALKLGFETQVTIPEHVTVPSKEDWNTFFETFMTKKEVGGNYQYTYDASKLLEAIDSILAWTEDHMETPVSDVIMELFGEAIRKSYPEIKNWSKLVSHIKKEFPGTMKVKDAVNKLVDFAENTGLITMDEIYSLIEAIYFEQGSEITVEDILDEYASTTLNALTKDITGDDSATFSSMIDMAAESLEEMLLGDILFGGSRDESAPSPDHDYNDVIQGGGTVVVVPNKPYRSNNDDALEMLGELRDMIANIELDLTIVLDKKGNLVSLSFDCDAPHYGTHSLKIKNDSKTTVTIPSQYADYLAEAITYQYDSKGNLIITGIPKNIDSDFSLSGYGTVNLKQLLTLDSNLTKKYGCNVYIIHEAFWETDYVLSEDCYLVDDEGNFYEYTVDYKGGYQIIRNTVSLTDLVTNPLKTIPSESSEPVAYYCPDKSLISSEFLPIYESILGYVCKIDNVWTLINQNESDYYYAWVSGLDEHVCVYTDITGMSYEDCARSIRVSNGDSANSSFIDESGKIYNNVFELYVECDLFDYNIGIYATIINNNVVLLETGYSDTKGTITIGNKLTSVPDYDELYDYYYYDDCVILLNGNIVDNFRMVRLETHVSVPQYYTEYDGVYFKIENDQNRYELPFSTQNVSGLETITLPNKDILYVKGSDGIVSQQGYTYGYIRVADKLYVQAAAYYVNGKWQHTVYRDLNSWYDYARSTMEVSLADLLDVNDYVTKNTDGSYVIAVEFLNLIKSYCTEAGDYARLYVEGVAQNNDNISLSLRKELFSVPYNNDSYNEPYYYLDWYSFMGDSTGSVDKPSYFFDVVTNSDGSITLKTSDGQFISIDFYFDSIDDIIVGDLDFLEYNKDMSNQTGLDIYSATKYYTNNCHYVLKNGKYYYFNYMSKYDIEQYETVSIGNILGKTWYVDNLYYCYDEVDTSGKYTGNAVFNGYIRFCSDLTHNSHELRSGFYCYLQIIDGKMYVLTDVEELGEGMIRYEDRMLIEDYIASLTLAENEKSLETNYRFQLNGNNINIHYIPVYDGDTLLTEIAVPYTKSGSRVTYYLITDWNEFEYLDIDYDSPVTLDNGEFVTGTHEYTDMNGKHSIVYTFQLEESTYDYVKVGMTYIPYYDYQNYSYTEDQFREYEGEHNYIYGVMNGNSWVFYNEYSWDYVNYDWYCVLSGQINLNYNDLYTNDWIGTTSDGKDVYEFIYYSIDHLECITLPDGKKFYYNYYDPMSGYIQMDNGDYLYANIQYVDDSYVLTNWDGYGDFNDQELIASALKLYDYIKIEKTGITIKPEILDVLENYRDVFNIYLDANSNWDYLYYNDLESLFSK